MWTFWSEYLLPNLLLLNKMTYHLYAWISVPTGQFYPPIFTSILCHTSYLWPLDSALFCWWIVKWVEYTILKELWWTKQYGHWTVHTSFLWSFSYCIVKALQVLWSMNPMIYEDLVRCLHCCLLFILIFESVTGIVNSR